MIELKDVVGGYGQKRVLNEVSLYIRASEIVGLVGPNGSGKSTVLKSIYGLVKVQTGDILFEGIKIQNRKPSINAANGIGYIPQGNKIFDRLNVQENLELGGFFLRDQKELNQRIDQIYKLFPVLAAHRTKVAGKLSGGERQMLGISRGLIMNPKLILLDEPSIGLAPKLVKQTMELIKKVRDRFETTILVVEQNVREVLKVVERVYVLRLGTIILEETEVGVGSEKKIKEVFLT